LNSVAQTCIDMKVQNHINTVNGTGWLRCKSVRFAGETATWELSRTGCYDFLEAYEKTPHRQLIRALDDESLRVFVKAWGPLRPALDDWSGSDPIEVYRKIRGRMTALARLLASAGDPEAQRSALLESIRNPLDINEGANWRHALTHAYKVAKIDRGVRFADWLEAAMPRQLELVATTYISQAAAPFAATRFTVERSGNGYVLRELLNFKSIVHALFWMVWQDVFRGRQFQFCVECPKLIPSTTRHARRFCSDECAHRKTAREWQQRKRERERKTDGTHKTR
jgi:hypothetical protein